MLVMMLPVVVRCIVGTIPQTMKKVLLPNTNQLAFGYRPILAPEPPARCCIQQDPGREPVNPSPEKL
jgi:hypothetical protein